MAVGPYAGKTGKFAGGRVESLPRFTPEQMSLYNKYVGMQGPGQEQMRQIAEGSPEYFQQLEAPAFRQFGETLGNISSRFSGAGDLGARRSSGFGRETTSAAQELAEKLQSNRLGLQRQATMDLYNMSEGLLRHQPYEQLLMPKKKKWWEQALGIGLPIAGAAAGAAFGMPQLGAAVGSMAGRAFAG